MKSGMCQEPPNIVILLADDMGMGDTSAYQSWSHNADSVQLHTPAMERLARMGVRFTDCALAAQSLYDIALCIAGGTLLLAHAAQTLGALWRAGGSVARPAASDFSRILAGGWLSNGYGRQVASRADLSQK